MKCRMCSSLVVGVFLGLGLALAASAQQGPIFITFDPPGSQGTIPDCLNQTGAIIGAYFDESNVYHGFVRAPDSTITTFNVLGAGTGSNQGTFVAGNNNEGAITGNTVDGSNAGHGYLRYPNGTITRFDVRGAGTGSGQGTFPGSINALGAITGDYVDANNVAHGFLRLPNGTITTFDVRGAGTGSGQGTWTPSCNGLNPQGAIVGLYYDDNNVSHGFLRAPDGTITTFNVPGAGNTEGSYEGTYPDGINAEGTILGLYFDDNNVSHGFVRGPDGTVTTFNVPGAGNTEGSYEGTYPETINSEGASTGYYTDATFFDHGFVRYPNGAFATFEVPGAGSAGPYQGTVPYGNNDAGAVTGYYTDSSGVEHGFLLTP